MWFMGAILTTVCFGVNNAIFKWSTGKGYSKVLLQFFFYVTAFLLSLGYGMAAGGLKASFLSILLGAAIGILNANGNIQMSKAYEKGPASLTSPIISSNAVFPVLSAAIIFHEHISPMQWGGILIILSSVAAIQYTPVSGKGKSDYYAWIYRIVLAVLSFGTLGILMKLSSTMGISSISILVSMYGGGCIYLLIIILAGKERARQREMKLGAIIGLISIAGYSSYFFALKTGIASIVFPLISLNCLIVVFAGCILFKEKIRAYQLVGVLSAILGIVLIKI
ncbi:EamA family transporter [Neobacillus piezotolerans]|uniref:EamA family transporter n=1 Tax=Neobacillus piezotolerans TaxID=2259171 RepID=A0A3D8GWE4_9BACI|nr:DMT family transporter [Neobacillus piezotolerans]RDU38765.1 EamA family transporter [Neobacillus piezotolerans]